jgi:hypothetical protein
MYIQRIQHQRLRRHRRLFVSSKSLLSLSSIGSVSFVVDLQKPLISQLFIAAKKQSRPKEKQSENMNKSLKPRQENRHLSVQHSPCHDEFPSLIHAIHGHL